MHRHVLSIIALGVLMDVAPGPALAADWTPLASLSEARHGAAAAALGGRVYVLGGRGAGDLATVAVWDAGAGSWSSAAAMSQARYQPGAAALGGYVYAMGGFDQFQFAMANVERLDPVSDTWSSVSGMPVSRAGMAVGVAAGSIIVAGGMTDDGMLQTECFRYDPVSDNWFPIAAMPVPREGAATAVVGDRMWVLGGSDGAPRARVDVYDALAGTWSTGPDLPEPLWRAASARVGDRVWIMGGVGAALTQSDRVYSAGFDGVWQVESALPAALSAAIAAATSADCVLLAGGLNGSGQPTASAWSGCNVAPPPPPPPPPPPGETFAVTVTLSPSSLNTGSQGNWISAHIETDGWPASEIVVESLRLDGVAPEPGSAVVGGTALTVKFPRAPFGSRPDGDYLLPLTGERSGGGSIEGTGALSVHGNWNGLNSRRKRPQPHDLRVVQTAGTRGAVAFSLAQPSEVEMDVLDAMGRTVAEASHETLGAGDHLREWPAAGQRVPSGIYLIRLRAAGLQAMVRLAVIR